MKLFVLFGQRKESYEGEYAPEALLVWDEYMVDDNFEGYEKAVADEKNKSAGWMQTMRVVTLEVNQDTIREMLIGEPIVKARIVG